MFKIGTQVVLDEDNWVRPAAVGEEPMGTVCGPPDIKNCRVSVSLNKAPDKVVAYYYNPRMCIDETNVLLEIYEKLTSRKSRKSKNQGGG